MVPITVIGAKYDLFQRGVEPAQKKLLCSALRYICHTNGCDLVFASVNEQQSLKVFKSAIAWHTFRHLANQQPAKAEDPEQQSEEQDKPQENPFAQLPNP